MASDYTTSNVSFPLRMKQSSHNNIAEAEISMQMTGRFNAGWSTVAKRYNVTYSLTPVTPIALSSIPYLAKGRQAWHVQIGFQKGDVDVVHMIAHKEPKEEKLERKSSSRGSERP